MMGDPNYYMTDNISETEKDNDWAAFFASESHSNHQSENYFDIASSSTSNKGKNVMESSDSKMLEFTDQPWNNAGVPMETPMAHSLSTLDFNAMPYKPQYNSMVGNLIPQQTKSNNSYQQQNNGISYNQTADSDLFSNIYSSWSPVVENDSERNIIPAVSAQTSMVNPLEHSTSFLNAPTAFAGPANSPAVEQQRLFNNQLLNLNDTRNDGGDYLRNQSYSSYFLSNLNNHNLVTTPMNPTNSNDTPIFYNQSPQVNNHALAPWNNQQVSGQISDFNLRSQLPRSPLGGKPNINVLSGLQKYNAFNFQQGQGTVPILESSKPILPMNTGHSSTPNAFDYRRSLVDQGNKDSSMFHAIHTQTNQPPTNIHKTSQESILKLLDPSKFQEKNHQSFFQETSKVVDSLKLKGDSNFPKYGSGRYKQQGTWSPLINQTVAPNYKINEQMQANPSEQLEIENSLDSEYFKFDPGEDMCLTADEEVDDPWLDQCYTQVQTIKKKCIPSLKLSLSVYDQRELVSGLSRNEKSDALALGTMINFLCMPKSEMKKLSLSDFAHTKRRIAIAYDKIMAALPKPEPSRAPTPSVSSLSIVRKGTSNLRENSTPKPPAPKRKRGSISNNKPINKSEDKRQKVCVVNDNQARVQSPGPNSLVNHQAQNAHNPTQEQQTVDNKNLGQESVPNHYAGLKPNLLSPLIAPNLNPWSNLNTQNNQKSSVLGDSQLLKTPVLKESPVPNNAIFSRPAIKSNIKNQNASRIAKEVAESEFGLTFEWNDDTVPQIEPILLSEKLQNKMKNVINNAATVRSSLAYKIGTEAGKKLLNEIKSVNENFADIKMELDSCEDCGEANKVDGIVLLCSYRATASYPHKSNRMPMPLHVFPVLKLRLIVPPAYPELSPSLVAPSANQPSKLVETLTSKAFELLFKCCRSLLIPMSLDGIATSWQASARAVTMDYGRNLGRGALSSFGDDGL